MKPILPSFSLVAALIAPLQAEDTLLTGLRGAFIAFAPVSEETSRKARTTAAELLAGYVDSRDGSSHAERTVGSTRVRMEMKGLRLTRVTKTALSRADRTNGIAERYLVAVACDMHRTFDSDTSSWSPWQPGMNRLMPMVIYAGRQTSGQWIASSPVIPSLTKWPPRAKPAAPRDGSRSLK